MLRIWGAPLIVLALSVTTSAATQNAYFVGNSLTNDASPNRMRTLATQSGNTLVYGWHRDNGASLHDSWSSPNNADQTESPYGKYNNALPNYTWDALVLQPYYDQLSGAESVFDRIDDFMNLARSRPANASTKLFIYQGYAAAGTPGSDYAALWSQTYDGTGTTANSRDYWQRVIEGVRGQSEYADVLLIPAGEVMFELDQRIRANALPGFTHISQLYVDELHGNTIGRYAAGLAMTSVLYGIDPRSLPVTDVYDANGFVLTPAQADVVQDAVWDVLTSDTYGFVIVPEPSAVTCAATMLILSLGQRRRAR